MTIRKPRRILVVEDEYFLADDLRKVLEGKGVTVVGPVSNEEDARTLLEGGAIDGAILDINLDGRMVYPLATALKEQGTPFLFLTGYDEVERASSFADVEVVHKPFTHQHLEAAIMRLTGDPTSSR